MTGLLSRPGGPVAARPHHRHPVPAAARPGRPVRDVVLASHGSRDPRAAEATERLRDVVAALRPQWRVRVAYLDFTAPSLGEALAGAPAGGGGPVTVVPLLLTPAYHAKIDIPAVVAASGTDAVIAPVLGPAPGAGAGGRAAFNMIVNALARRLAEVGGAGAGAVVLGAAGSRDATALASVDAVASALGERWGRPVLAGYASGAGRPVGEAIEVAMRVGAGNVVIARYFLAPGVLSDRIVAAAREAGVGAVAAPLSDAAEVAQLVIYRVERGVMAG